jgi:L,D-transpeptidase ErfK/SrfK
MPARRPLAILNAKADAASAKDALPAFDVDETVPLPPYPPKARMAMGKLSTYTLGEEDTLLDVARHFRLGFVEVRAANPDTDPWTPVPGSDVVIPSFRLLPRAEQTGIVVNLAQMRLYYFKDGKKYPVTFPIGVGREGLQTPTGETTIIRKLAGPSWYPTERMLEEKPYLPKIVPAGNSNPLGSHALYLGWPTFLIHGSNKPWAIGRRVSSGCMRMYPEDITEVFKTVPVGTHVTVVDQPILVAWVGDNLYLEANPSKTQGNDIEINGEHAIKPLDDAMKKVILDAAIIKPEMIDWDIVKVVLEERRGYPVVIANAKTPPAPPKKEAAPVESVDRYN